eukprot:Nk52_evm28s96 gene=Nk52_evmTU28s96
MSGAQTSNAEKRKAAHTNANFSDDHTTTFFWRPHTITPLIATIAYFIYIALFDTEEYSSAQNTKRSLYAVVFVFLLISAVHFRDGPFIRPHPVLWRVVFGCSILYLIGLVVLLFQNASDARYLLTYLDPSLNVLLPEISYAENCEIFTSNSTFWEKIDIFVLAHFFGWWAKAIVIRDLWVCWVISVMFEFCEYTLEFQLPNFKECWWDHWVLDVLVCNWGGIYFGMKTCKYLEMKQYSWRGIQNIPDYKGKMIRAASQFTPYRWTSFHWGATESLKRFVSVCLVIAIFLLAEVNAFYLKFVLWIPPPNYLNLARLVLMFCMGTVAMRETYEYLADSKCKRFGQQAWIVICIIAVEVLIILKFGKGSYPTTPPPHVINFWISFFTILALWMIWHFGFKKRITRVNKVD